MCVCLCVYEGFVNKINGSMTRPPLFSHLFELFPWAKDRVISPPEGFHMCHYILNWHLAALVLAIPKDNPIVGSIQGALGLAESFSSLGNMTSSVQVMFNRFDTCVQCLIFVAA